MKYSLARVMCISQIDTVLFHKQKLKQINVPNTCETVNNPAVRCILAGGTLALIAV